MESDFNDGNLMVIDTSFYVAEGKIVERIIVGKFKVKKLRKFISFIGWYQPMNDTNLFRLT